MIHGLDRITLAVPSPAAALQSYATLLGRTGTGEGRAFFQLANVRLELVGSDFADRGRLAGLTFAVADLAKAHDLFLRRGLRLEMVGAGQAGQAHLAIATDATCGVPVTLVERRPAGIGATSPPTSADEAAVVTGLDHVVIRTPDPERAVALYGARFGLSLRLDRSDPALGARLLFFRCGDLVVELAHDLKAGISDGPDTLWGLSWRVPGIACAHARLAAAGVEVSDVRAGRRAGSQVFTVRSHTAAIPTIVIGAG
jgi:catechol 2,3-dioxygenase-like lactoylglutathione lyase family enzyme